MTDPTPVPTATGLTFGSFTAVGTNPNPNASGRFSFQNWPTGATNGNDTYASLAGSLDPAEYYSVTITPDEGFQMTLTALSFDVMRSGTGIRTYAVRSDAGADNFTTNLPASLSPLNADLSVQPGNVFFWNSDANTATESGSTITFSTPSFQNVTSSITLHFYGWNAEGSAGTFSIDYVVFSGSVSPLTVPEPPAAAAILGTAMLGAILLMRHGRREQAVPAK